MATQGSETWVHLVSTARYGRFGLTRDCGVLGLSLFHGGEKACSKQLRLHRGQTFMPSGVPPMLLGQHLYQRAGKQNERWIEGLLDCLYCDRGDKYV